MKSALAVDNFDNGRTARQLAQSFRNSHSICIAYAGGRIIGTARVLSDGVCNAYFVDMWTHSEFRRQGIARKMMKMLLEQLPGQHVYLQADDDVAGFYARIGFAPQPNGMSQVVGRWLRKGPGRS